MSSKIYSDFLPSSSSSSVLLSAQEAARRADNAPCHGASRSCIVCSARSAGMPRRCGLSVGGFERPAAGSPVAARHDDDGAAVAGIALLTRDPTRYRTYFPRSRVDSARIQSHAEPLEVAHQRDCSMVAPRRGNGASLRSGLHGGRSHPGRRQGARDERDEAEDVQRGARDEVAQNERAHLRRNVRKPLLAGSVFVCTTKIPLSSVGAGARAL